MYTASLKSKTFQRAANRILVVVEVTDGTTPFDKEFSFAPNTEVDAMKRTVKQYLDELNGAEDKVTALDDLNYTEPSDQTPDPADVAFADWNKKLQQLVAANVGATLGLEVATAAQINTLKTAVQNGLVKSDERYISALAQYANLI